MRLALAAAAALAAFALAGCVAGSDRVSGSANGFRVAGYSAGYTVTANGVRYLCRGQKSRGTRRLLEDTLADAAAETGRVDVPLKASEAGFVCTRG